MHDQFSPHLTTMASKPSSLLSLLLPLVILLLQLSTATPQSTPPPPTPSPSPPPPPSPSPPPPSPSPPSPSPPPPPPSPPDYHYIPIPTQDLQDSLLQDLGKYAVNTHNEETDFNDVFIGVVAGSVQTQTRGSFYNLVIVLNTTRTPNYNSIAFVFLDEEKAKNFHNLTYLETESDVLRIDNLSDTHIQDLATFAVSEYNKTNDGDLVYLNLVEGTSRVVDGIDYQFVIHSHSPSNDPHKDALAVVFEKPWDGSRTLVKFDVWP